MARFWIGTSGWQYDHWRGPFYPQDLAKSRWLDYYAQRFPTVELNNSFYRLPSEKSWERWHETVPDGFRFAIKASRFITHFRRLNDCRESLRLLYEGVRRLGDRRGPVLFQLPPDFERNETTAVRLEAFLDLLEAGQEHAFEFRHDSWFGAETLALLGRHGAGFCSYDMPGRNCPVVATAPFAYFRFHGTEAHYGGKYSDDQLASWAGRLREIGRNTESVWAYFNNDPYGHAVENALRLTEMLS